MKVQGKVIVNYVFKDKIIESTGKEVMGKIEISEVQIVPVKPKDGLVAFASCVINNQLYLGDIAIYTLLGKDDFRLVYPSKILPTGKQINCVHPINREAGEAIKEAVITKFRELMLRRSDEGARNEDHYSKI